MPNSTCSRLGKPVVRSHIVTAVMAMAVSALLVIFIQSSVNNATLNVNDCKPLLATSEPPRRRPCPPDWIGYRKKCLYFSDKEETWMASQKFCALYNASLAIIEKEDTDFVRRYKGVASHWIGLHRDPNQPWKWINGNVSTWEILGDGGNCAFLNDEGRASCSRCHTGHLWICSKPDEFTSKDGIE